MDKVFGWICGSQYSGHGVEEQRFGPRRCCLRLTGGIPEVYSQDAEIRTAWGSGEALVFGPLLRSRPGSYPWPRLAVARKAPSFLVQRSSFLMVPRTGDTGQIGGCL